MKNQSGSDPDYRILLHRKSVSFGSTLKAVLRSNYPTLQVSLATDCQGAARTLTTDPVDFCVLDLDDSGSADLYYDVQAVFPDIGVLLTSARLPEERPTLPPPDESRVLYLNAASTPTQLGETIREILGLAAPVKAPPQEMFELVGGTPQTRRLSGNLQVLLPDLVQLKCLTGRSCVLEISAEHDTGQIYFQNGDILHAATRELKGLPALMAIFGWKNSRFAERPWSQAPARTVHQRWEAILLEVSRVADEAEHLARSRPLTAVTVSSEPLAA